MPLELAIACFPGDPGAESAFGTLRERSGQAPWTRHALLVQHHRNNRVALQGTLDGHYVALNEEDHLSQRGAAAGAVIGAIGGLLVAGPFGLPAGLVAGSMVGAQRGRDDELEYSPGTIADDLRRAVPKGSSAIVLLGPRDEVDAFSAALAGRTELRRRAVPDAELRELRAALASTPAAAQHGTPPGTSRGHHAPRA